MALETDPIDYADVDSAGTHSAALPLAEAVNGFGAVVLTKEKFNALMRNASRWKRWLDQGRVPTPQAQGASTCRLSTTAFSFAAGGGLNKVVNVDTHYLIQGSYVSLSVARLAANIVSFTATATKDTHFYITPAGVITWDVVTIGVAAAPPVGTVHLHTFRTDGTDVTSQTTPAAFTAQRNLFAIPVETSAGITTTSLTASADSTLAVTSSNYALSITQSDGAGGGLYIANSGNGPKAALEILQTGDGTGLAINASAGLNAAISVIGSPSDSAVKIEAGAGQAGLYVQGAATGNYAVRLRGGAGQLYVLHAEAGAGGVGGDAGAGYFEGSGTGPGLHVRGGGGAGAYAAEFLAQNSTTVGAVYARTHTTATFASRAGYFQGHDQAAGLEAVSAGYYPAILTPDVTSPTYGHIFGAAQNAAPTQVGLGALACVAGTINGWGQANDSEPAWRWFHASPGGYVYGAAYQQSVTSTSSVSYSNLALADCTGMNAPKVAGEKVRISVKLRFRTGTATATGVDIRVIDFTADPGGASPLIVFEGSGTSTSSGMYLSGVNTNYNETLPFEFDYTIPSAGDRSFILQIRRWGAVSVTGHGSITIDGV